ncbi:MAG TPA: hypothetical protein VJA86_00565 [Candidatus Nanoarchaeia archaeon]|nr:hypothetical protein [Candidatus Nanoarchaeia archaeon]
MGEKKEAVYLGVWFQRTSLHLKEVYEFLKHKKGVKELDGQKLEALWSALQITDPMYHEEETLEFIDAKSNAITFSMTEDGIMLLSAPLSQRRETTEELERYYSKCVGPALNYLFSRGAPIPKDLTVISGAYPVYFAVYNRSKEECLDFFREYKDNAFSFIKNSDTEIYIGKRVAVINVLRQTMSPAKFFDVIRNIVLFREFERQLNHYLNLHRKLWDKISAIRDAERIRYRDFSIVRENLFDYLKTISFVKARLLQMHDILHARGGSIEPDIKRQLKALQLFDRFKMLDSSHDYVNHLWDMTSDYAKSTLTLLESLYTENTQRELNALIFITIVGAAVSFFGMNIGFPWEDRWPYVFKSSFYVIGLIVIIAVLAYSLLRILITKRQFKVKERAQEREFRERFS